MKTLNEIKNEIKKLSFTPDAFRIYIKEDTYENTSDPELLEITEFKTIEEAYNLYINEVKNIKTIESTSEIPDFKLIEIQAGEDDFYDMEVLDDEEYIMDYTEDYGKLVIQFHHVGKGMNYAHEFKGLFFLDKYTEKYLSNNPDKRFTMHTRILEIKKEDFNNLNLDEAIDLIKNEANLKLQNYIALDDIENEIELI